MEYVLAFFWLVFFLWLVVLIFFVLKFLNLFGWLAKIAKKTRWRLRR